MRRALKAKLEYAKFLQVTLGKQKQTPLFSLFSLFLPPLSQLLASIFEGASCLFEVQCEIIVNG